MYTNLTKRALLFAVLTAIFMVFSCYAYAQELNISDTTTFEAADTINPDPEWYVAPLSRDSVRAGKRALVAAATCTIDSVQIFNVDSVLTGVTVYENGDTTRTMTWTINSDGSRFGSSRTEEKTTGDVTFSASYEWDFTANDWKGISKEEHTFAGGIETLRTLYDWQNGAWSANKQYTWVYDADGRETEYTTYVRNANGTLAYSQQRLREYNAAGRTVLDIQYTAHNGTDWSAGTKVVYDYDGSNKVLDESYTLSNGAWVGLSKKVWEYTSGKNTYYEVFGWSNGAWVGSSKEIWEFNGPSAKQTLHEKYGWANGDWSIMLQENSGYDAAGNNILIENYSYTNGVQKGSKKTTYTFNSANKQTGNITYKWTNNAWVESVWTVTGYDAAGNKNESCKYNWKNDAWEGAGIRTLTTYNSSKNPTEVITQNWPTNATDWVNATRKTTEYEGSKTTQEATYVWQNEAWVGISRSDWHYNTAGQNDTIKTYTYVETEWAYLDRTINTYDSHGNTIETVNASWNGTEWVPTSINKGTYTYTNSGKPLLAETYTGLEGAWRGIEKVEYMYDEEDRQISYWQYEWRNGDWGYKNHTEQAYDEYGHQTLNLSYSWTSNTWRGVYKYEYAYEGDRIVSQSQYIGVVGGWAGFSKTNYTYYESGKQQTVISFSWNNNDWTYNQKTEYKYDAQGRMIDRKISQYNNNVWINNQWRIQSYDSRGQEVLLREYRWINNSWVVILRAEKEYDIVDNKIRRELNGSWTTSGTQNSFSDNHYFYSCDPHLYTIRFLNENGAILESKQVQNGAMPAYSGETPTKESTAEYTYTFAGWDKTIAAATADATYTATFSATKRQYTITWLNDDGSQIDQTTVEYNLTPAHADINKESTAEYTYTFAGWDKEITPVNGDATYKATFTATKRQYTITWLNEDNSQLAQTTVEYGVMPTAPEAPSKGATAEYTYAFAGWDNELVAVEGDATYTATFTATKRQYTVTWLNEDNSQLAQTTVEYGVIPTAPEAPSKGATAEYTYAFAGWDKELVAVEGDATYTATFTATRNTYTVTWLNSDNSPLYQESVEYGVTPVYTGATPTQESTAEYTYAFAGWDKEFVAVEGDATYTATFTATKNKYTVTWLNSDNSPLYQEEVEYGVIPTAPEVPSKGATAEYTYAFAGWDKELVAVEGDATYTATFSATKRQYTITWLNEDNSQLAQTTVEYGVIPTAPDAPSKGATAEYTYAFSGWDKELVSVEGDATYTATFTATKRQYTITWLNSDNSPLYQEEVAYGATPVYTGATPTQESTAEYTYTFVGWDSDPAPVTGAAIYKAVYSSNKNSYTVTFYFEDGVTVLDSQVLEYGETPSTGMTPSKNDEEHYYYTFTGWYPEITPVTGDASYTPVYTKEPKQYTITFNNYNGRQLWTTTVPYGETPVYNGETPTRQRTQQYSYEFAGWSPELTAVSGDATYTAFFNAIVNQYTVVFQNEDGTELERQMVDYGTKPEYQGETPTKEPDAEYRYEFAGWTPRIVAVFTDATYTATYTRHDLHEGIDNVQPPCMEAQKVLINGILYILRGDKVYTTDGVLVE